MNRWTMPLGILALALLLAGALSQLASESPDGLERVAHDLGFAGAEATRPLPTAVMPDYAVRSLSRSFWGRAAAGVLGTLVVLAASLGLGTLLRRRPETPTR